MAETHGELLRRARRGAGLTLSQVAESVGVSAATLSRAETGHARMKTVHLRRYAELLGLDLAELEHRSTDLSAADLETTHAAPGLFVPGHTGTWRVYEDLVLEPSLAAAADCFVELGYHGTSVRDLAHRAGLSVPALYHRYPSKHDLLVSVMEVIMTDFRARCEGARADGHSPGERFALLVECFALFHTYRRDLAFIGASEMRGLDPPDRRRIAALRRDCQHMIDREVEAMVEQGLADIEDPGDSARAVVTMLVGIANWYRREGQLSPEEIAQRYVVHAEALICRRAH